MKFDRDDFLKYCKIELLEYEEHRPYVSDTDYLGFFLNLMDFVFDCEDAENLKSPAEYADYFVHGASWSDFDDELEEGEDDDDLVSRVRGNALFVDSENRKICWSF